MLMVPNLRLVEANNIYRKVPTRKPNAEMRTREYLTPAEVEKLIAAAKLGRHGHRDATLILVAFRHGLRAVEIADLEWSQVEWGRNPALHVRRAKNGKPAVHPIRGDELRMLRELQRNTTGAFIFETERGGPFTADAVNRRNVVTPAIWISVCLIHCTRICLYEHSFGFTCLICSPSAVRRVHRQAG